MLIWIEAGLACLTLFLALPLAKFNPRWMVSAEQAFSRIAQRQRFSVVLVGLLAILARVAILPILPQPEPSINDEFSHLLAADTFAHGRVTNPPHPMWIHFETFHEIQQPTHASMYPPAQGLILGFGQAITGNAFVGVCLSVALFCAALCWMLQAWTSPSYALLGGLLAILRFGMFSYWANSYWGGAMAGLGGALVLGALPRILKTQSWPAAVTMGVGVAILANSRPFEGLALSIPVAIVLMVWLVRQFRLTPWLVTVRVVLPMFLVLGLAGAGTGYYFWRVTGSPTRMPQMVDRDTYAVAPYFLWQSPRPEPVYHHPAMRNFYIHAELDFYEGNRSALSMVALTIVKLFDIWLFYLGPVLTLPLLLAGFAAPRTVKWATLAPETRILVIAFAAWFAALALEVFFFPHYAAPVVGLLYALVFRSMRFVRSMQRDGRAVGVFFTRSIPAVCLLLLSLRVIAGFANVAISPDWPPMWFNATPMKTRRVQVLAELESYPGKQLALVRYADTHKPGSRYDWVYNRADVDGAKVVWARDMGEASNQELVGYFKDRKVWLVAPDKEGSELSPY